MLFNSYEFIFLFLPAVYVVFLLLGQLKHKAAPVAWLVLASLFFYGWWNPAYLILICGSTVFNYLLGNSVYKLNDKGIAKVVCGIGIVLNLGVLGYFKYMNFFVDNINAILNTQIEIAPIILPLAISFFTFQQISFLTDSLSRKTHEFNFLNYCLFVTFFPQLIAGPIVHHGEMLPQFAKEKTFHFNASNLAIGGTIFLLGLFKKVVIADSIAVYATPVFSAASNGDPVSFFEAWGGAIAYTLQIYFDFSGYSDMAIGLARIFGILLPLNFNSPYKSLNIIEFWRRWHMTLSRFLRDYVYIPLGGNRKGVTRRHVNLMTVMLVGGLWHGAGWTFVTWGALHGIYLVINHFWSLWAYEKRGWTFNNGALWRWFARGLTFIAVVFAWVFFRADDFSSAIQLCRSMFGLEGIALPKYYAGYFRQLGISIEQVTSWGIQLKEVPNFVRPSTFGLMGLLLAICWVMPNTQELMRERKPALDFVPPKSLPRLYRWLKWQPNTLTLFIVLCMAIYSFVSMTGVSEFLYFQF